MNCTTIGQHVQEGTSPIRFINRTRQWRSVFKNPCKLHSLVMVHMWSACYMCKWHVLGMSLAHSSPLIACHLILYLVMQNCSNDRVEFTGRQNNRSRWFQDQRHSGKGLFSPGVEFSLPYFKVEWYDDPYPTMQVASGAHINVSRNIPKSTERLITIKVIQLQQQQQQYWSFSEAKYQPKY